MVTPSLQMSQLKHRAVKLPAEANMPSTAAGICPTAWLRSPATTQILCFHSLELLCPAQHCHLPCLSSLSVQMGGGGEAHPLLHGSEMIPSSDSKCTETEL